MTKAEVDKMRTALAKRCDQWKLTSHTQCVTCAETLMQMSKPLTMTMTGLRRVKGCGRCAHTIAVVHAWLCDECARLLVAFCAGGREA